MLCTFLHSFEQFLNESWYEAVVRRVKGKNICLHFLGWESTWDEVVNLGSGRIAPRGTARNSTLNSRNAPCYESSKSWVVAERDSTGEQNAMTIHHSLYVKKLEKMEREMTDYISKNSKKICASKTPSLFMNCHKETHKNMADFFYKCHDP